MDTFIYYSKKMPFLHFLGKIFFLLHFKNYITQIYTVVSYTYSSTKSLFLIKLGGSNLELEQFLLGAKKGAKWHKVDRAKWHIVAFLCICSSHKYGIWKADDGSCQDCIFILVYADFFVIGAKK